MGAQSLHFEGVATKLDTVTQALFGMQEHGFTDQRCIPQPQRLRKVAFTRTESVPLPAPLVELPTLRKVAAEQQFNRLVPVRIRIIGLDGNCGVVACYGFITALQFLQGQATVVEGVGGIGL